MFREEGALRYMLHKVVLGEYDTPLSLPFSESTRDLRSGFFVIKIEYLRGEGQSNECAELFAEYKTCLTVSFLPSTLC
jgi:hypothetical protein